MRTRWIAVATAIALGTTVSAWAHDPAPSPTVEWIDPESEQAKGSALNMAAVGHHDLGGRGYNADVWVHERYAYVGSWGFSDWASGSKQRFCPNDGVAVVDTRDAAHPRQVATLVSPSGTSAEDVVVLTAGSERAAAPAGCTSSRCRIAPIWSGRSSTPACRRASTANRVRSAAAAT